MVEVLIGLCLWVGLGGWPAYALASGLLLRRKDLQPFEMMGTLAFLYLAWVPLARGVAQGWALADVLRDWLPMLFLFLPLLVHRRFLGCEATGRRIVAAGLAGAGILFALRWWSDAGWWFAGIGRVAMADGADYLLNAPSVVFAAVLLPLLGCRLLCERATPWHLLVAGGLCVLGGIGVAGVAGAVHRFALAGIVAAYLCFAVWYLSRSVLPLAFVLGGVAIAIVAAPLPLVGVIDHVNEKSRLVGANARIEETTAVLNFVGKSWVSIVIGEGWGAVFRNPAVGWWAVSFTHALPTYLLLKSGLIGVLLTLGYLVCLIPEATRLLTRDVPLTLAVIAACAGGLVLYTSFKFLDFGLCLALVVLADGPGAPRARPGDAGRKTLRSRDT